MLRLTINHLLFFFQVGILKSFKNKLIPEKDYQYQFEMLSQAIAVKVNFFLNRTCVFFHFLHAMKNLWHFRKKGTEIVFDSDYKILFQVSNLWKGMNLKKFYSEKNTLVNAGICTRLF